MKPINIILWLQLVLGIVGAFIAFGDIHSAALGMEWGRGMQREFEQVRQSPEYREPPAIRGYSLSRFVEGVETDAYKRSRIAGLAFFSCLSGSVFAAVLLWLNYRLGRRRQANTS
ncbi:MAG: hypothetical protein AAB370_08590 [Verrucomicrobiota bacterium]